MNISSLPHRHVDQKNPLFLQQALQSIEEFRTVSELFSQLSDPTRIRVFWLLCHCEECVINISALLGMSSPAVSHHLRILKEAGLITSRRNGREVFYTASETECAGHLHLMIEQIMSLTCPEEAHLLSDCRADQVEVIRSVHDYLLGHLEERVPIDVLARQFAMNPTTLKSVFKSVYGNSLAAHIKEHRMEHAATLLLETDLSVLEIANRVGYDSQSKFSAAFKGTYAMLPTEYRKNGQKN